MNFSKFCVGTSVSLPSMWWILSQQDLKRPTAKNRIAAWMQCWTWPYKPSWLVGSLADIFILTLVFVFFQHINHSMYSPSLTLIVIIPS